MAGRNGSTPNGKGKSKRIGRPTLFTEQVVKDLMAVLSTGGTTKDACAMAGIGDSTFYEWQQIGLAHLEGRPHRRMPWHIKHREELAEFAKSVKKARATARFRAVSTIQRVSNDRWRHIQTGEIRTVLPPPLTWLNTRTGQTIFDNPATLGYPLDEWEQQWSGEVWTLMSGDWKAQAWYLERSDFDNWGRKVKVESDWRKEAEQMGLSPGDLFEQMVNEVAGLMEAGDE